MGIVDPPPYETSPPLRALLPIFVILVCCAALLLSIFTSTGVELYEPPGFETYGMVVGFGLGIACLIVGLKKPRSWKIVATVILWSLIAGTISMLTTDIVLDRLHEAIVFRGAGMTASTQDLPVRSASIHRYKGVTYRVWLRNYAALLEVDENDYRAAFGTAEDVHPVGYCVRVTVQTSGRWSRIIADNGMKLPPGSLQRCSGTTG